MRLNLTALVGAILFSLSTLAMVEEAAAGDPDAGERVCINSRLIRGFDGLSDEHVFVEERKNSYYLITMKNRCFGLRHANGIAIKDATSSVCSRRFGEIMYRESGRGISSCRIDTIEAVESKDAAKALIAERKQAK